MLPSGLKSAKLQPHLAYQLTYRDPYHQAGMGGELYFAKSRGGAVSQWMKQNYEYDYMACLSLFRVHRSRDDDWLTLLLSDTEDGKRICTTYSSLQPEQKLSLLALGGVDIRHYSMKLEKLKVQSIRGEAWIDFYEHPGTVCDSCEPMLCDVDGMITLTQFTHFPELYARTLTPFGQSVFLLVLQDFAHSMGNHLSQRIIKKWLDIQKYGNDSLIIESKSLQPRLFHRNFQKPPKELGNRPCRIYSGQWGMYWVDTSGYSNNKAKCRVFTLSEAAAQVSHCGPEKWIYLVLLSEDERSGFESAA